LVRARIGALQDAHRLLLARLDSPIFDPLRPALARLPRDRWPTHAELTALATGLTTSSGMPLRFIAPRQHSDTARRYYEPHIAQTGEVKTRAENWHDLFNALVWVTFPRAKAAINAQHTAILEERGDAEAKRRGPERDALTLFDESGVIVATDDAALSKLIVDFEWKEIFWRRREEVARRMRFFAFGHALYEKALQPYIGMVAKTVFVPFAADVAAADALLEAHFSDRSRFIRPKEMAPMPVLGVPGWDARNAVQAFYDDKSHFRGKRPLEKGPRGVK
jgi:Protein of unknown function (DUF3025)